MLVMNVSGIDWGGRPNLKIFPNSRNKQTNKWTNKQKKKLVIFKVKVRKSPLVPME